MPILLRSSLRHLSNLARPERLFKSHSGEMREKPCRANTSPQSCASFQPSSLTRTTRPSFSPFVRSRCFSRVRSTNVTWHGSMISLLPALVLHIVRTPFVVHKISLLRHCPSRYICISCNCLVRAEALPVIMYPVMRSDSRLQTTSTFSHVLVNPQCATLDLHE